MQDADSCPRCPLETRRREMALTAQDSMRAKKKGGCSLARLLVLSSLALRQHCSEVRVHPRSPRAQFLSQHPNRVRPPENYPSGALWRPGLPPSAPCLRRPDTQHPWQDAVRTSSCVVARGGLHLEGTHKQRHPLVSTRDCGGALALAQENGDMLREERCFSRYIAAAARQEDNTTALATPRRQAAARMPSAQQHNTAYAHCPLWH